VGSLEVIPANVSPYANQHFDCSVEVCQKSEKEKENGNILSNVPFF
jgi:hypothetical protein